MIETRVIPCLLLENGGLVKTTKFKDATYLGDPINICRIFNDKEVHEIVLLDIGATVERRPPPFALLKDMAVECFIPLAYGGGLRDVETIRRVLELGLEKVVINSAAVENPGLVEAAARLVGSSSVVVAIDVRKKLLGGYEVATHSGTKKLKLDPVTHAKRMQDCGAGEVFLTSIDREGTMSGYDLDLIARVAAAVSIPVVANGGAGSVKDFGLAVNEGHASAVAAGSLFVFQGKHRAVLVTYPEHEVLHGVLP